MLGHSTGDVTEGYIHKFDPVLAAAADRVAGAIHADLTDGWIRCWEGKKDL